MMARRALTWAAVFFLALSCNAHESMAEDGGSADDCPFLSVAPPVTAHTEPVVGTVVDLTDGDFDTTINVAGDESWFIVFYQYPGCPQCTRWLGTLEGVAQEMAGDPTFRLARVDGRKEQRTTARFGVTEFPAIFYLHHDTLFTYSGERTEKDVINFALSGFMSEYKSPTTRRAPPPLAHGEL